METQIASGNFERLNPYYDLLTQKFTNTVNLNC